MATRYYLTKKSPGVMLSNESYVHDWDEDIGGPRLHKQRGWYTWEMSTSKTNGGRNTSYTVGELNDTAGYEIAFMRFTTPRLAAQTISGTLTLCVPTWGSDDASTTYYCVHAYSTVGDTSTVRDVILDHYVGAVNWNAGTPSFVTCRAFTEAIASTTVSAGDRIMIELGVQFASNSAGDAFDTTATVRLGTNNSSNVPYSDAVNGNTGTTWAPWCEFSATVTEQASVAAPANDACADAIVISSLPYDGSGYDTTQSADTNRAVWYQYTSDSDHYVYFGTLTSNYETQITVYTGSCGSLSTVVTWFKEQFLQESQSVYWWWAETGVTYRIKVESSAVYHNTAPQSGGWLAFQLWEYDATLQSGDLFVDCQHLVRWREGVGFVDFTSDLYGQTPTGNAIDYTARELQDLYANPHTNTRLYVCCFGTSPLVEVVDAQDLSYEVAFIDTALDPSQNLSSIVFDQAGNIYTGAFGDNYDHIGQLATAGTAPIMKTSGLNVVTDAGYPLGSTQYDADYDVQGTDFADLATDQSTLHYTSAGREIKRYNSVGDAQLPDFASVAYEAKIRPGFRSVRQLPDGGLLACDGDHVKRFDSGGNVIQTYYPSATDRAQDLDKVELTPDVAAFWVSDQLSTSLFKFNLATGAQLGDYELNLPIGQLCGFSVYLGYRPGVTPEGSAWGGVTTPPSVVASEGVLGEVPVPTPQRSLVRRIRRVRRAPHLVADGLWAFYTRFQLDLEAGVGLSDGQGEDPQLMLRWSDDGGHTWSDEHWVSAGRIGTYAQRAIWRRLGRSRDRIFEVVISDPVKVAWVGAWIDVAPGVH